MVKPKNNNDDKVRLTLDMPKASYIKLKTASAVEGKSMRKIIIELIEERGCKRPHEPNEKLRKVIDNIERGGDIESFDNLEDLFKYLDS